MSGERLYDIFLSHNSIDAPSVDGLARRLHRLGIKPFLDTWHLIPGEPWQEALEEALDQSRTCAVIVGPSGISPWENEEMRAALEMRARSSDYRVIPVLLPQATLPKRGRLPGFLSRLTWVDFRRGLEDEEALRRLACGIRGVAPESVADREITEEGVCPYRGLQPFDEEHANFFFGRDTLVQRMVEDLRESPFLAVIGSSGSGKSSAVRAGLIPAVRRGVLPSSEDWRVIVFTPGVRPLEELAYQLVSLIPDRVRRVDTALQIERKLESDQRALHSLVRVALADESSATRVLLVVDQFEELFTLCRNEKQRKLFLDNLLYASGVAWARAVVVLTLRADFFGHAARYHELADRIADHQIVVSHLAEAEFRAAIERPASRVGLEFDDGLVDSILTDVEGQPGGLPLLQYALLELWERRVDRRLSRATYLEIGGVAGAVARRADKEYDALLPEQRLIAKRILLRLVQPGKGTEDTLRRAPRSELLPTLGQAPEVESVIQKLAEARLVTAGSEAASETETVVLAHEALIKGWPRLRIWIEDERVALPIQRRLTARAEEWLRLSKDHGALLRGAQLIEATDWSSERLHEMSGLEGEFLDASQSSQAKEAKDREDRLARELESARKVAKVEAEARKKIRRRARWLGLMTILAVITCTLAAALWRRANNERRDSTSRELAAKASNALEKQQPELSLLLSIEALGALKDPSRRTNPAAETALRRVLAMTTSIPLPSQYEIRSSVLSPSGLQIAVGGAPTDNIVLWDLASNRPAPVELEGHAPTVFSPDGRSLISACDIKRVCVWDLPVESMAPPWRIFGGHPEKVTALTVNQRSPFVLASASKDGTIRVRDLSGERPRFTFNADVTQEVPTPTYASGSGQPGDGPTYMGPAGVIGLHLNPDATFLVAESMLGFGRWPFRAHLWKMVDGLSTESTLSMRAPRISPDGGWLAGVVAGNLELSRLGPLDNGHALEASALVPRKRYGAADNILSFNADSRWLITSRGQSALDLWCLRNQDWQRLDVDLNEADILRQAEFAPNGKWLAVAEQGGSVGVWSLRSDGRPEHTSLQEEHEGDIIFLRFSPESSRLIALSADGSLLIWTISNEEVVAFERALQSLSKPTSPLEISADDRWLIGTGSEGTLRLWSMDSERGTSEPRVARVGNGKDNSIVTSQNQKWVALWDQEEASVEVWPTGVSTFSERNSISLLLEREERPRALSDNGRWLVSGSSDSFLRIRDLHERPYPIPFTVVENLTARNVVAIDSTAKQLAIADQSGQITLYTQDKSTWKETAIFGNKDRLRQLSFSPDGQWLAAVSSNSFSPERAKLWNLAHLFSSSTSEALSLRGHLSPVTTATFDSGSRFFATGDDGGTVLLWRRPFVAEPIRLGAEAAPTAGRIRLLSFSANAQWLMAAWHGRGSHYVGAVWNLTRGRPEESPTLITDLGEGSPLAAFDASGSYLATTGSDGTMRLWSLVEGRLTKESVLLPIPGSKGRSRLVAWSEDGEWLTRITSNGAITQWSLSLASLIRRGCEVAGRNLSIAEWRGLYPDKRYHKTCHAIPVHPSLISEARELIKSGFQTDGSLLIERILKLEPDLDIDPLREILIAQASRANHEGRALAKLGSLDEAEARFRRAIELNPALEIDPEQDARSLAAEAKFWQARELVRRGGDFEEVATLIEGSLAARGKPWPESFLDREGWSIVASEIHKSGHSFARSGRYRKAMAAFRAAELMDPRVSMSAFDWNSICYWGSLWENADEVLAHCEHLIRLEPANGGYRDSRGVARALTGNNAGAIEDFKFFVEWAGGNKEINATDVWQREKWIAELSKGNQPLNIETLEALRGAKEDSNQ